MKRFLHSVWGIVVCALLSLFIPTQTSAQEGFKEAGFTLAPSNFLGDLGGNFGRGTTFLKDNNFEMTKIMFGGHLSIYPKDWIGLRIAANVGKLEGDDAVIDDKGGLETGRKYRNLNFRSRLIEAFAAAEFYPTVFLEYDPTDVFHKIRPYGLIGVGVFNFNPQGLDAATGQWVNLKELHTEGQGFKEYPDRPEYKLTQLNIPMGVGIKYWASDNVSIGLEVIHRKTFTDYIDDVSTAYIDPQLFYNNLPLDKAVLAQRMADKSPNGNTQTQIGGKRGTPQNNDSYYSFGFKIGIRLGAGSDRGYRNSTRCPVIRF
ncbi:MAG: hypothetical protein RLZZ316_2289 [Bacteroidota bacterium]